MIPKDTYTVFKNECSQFKNNVLKYLSVYTKFPLLSGYRFCAIWLLKNDLKRWILLSLDLFCLNQISL